MTQIALEQLQPGQFIVAETEEQPEGLAVGLVLTYDGQTVRIRLIYTEEVVAYRAGLLGPIHLVTLSTSPSARATGSGPDQQPRSTETQNLTFIANIIRTERRKAQSAIPAVIGTAVLDFLGAVEGLEPSAAIEKAQQIRDDLQKRMSYYDPTTNPSSAGNALAQAAGLAAQREVIRIADDLIRYRDQ